MSAVAAPVGITGNYGWVEADMVEPQVVQDALKHVRDYIGERKTTPVRDGLIPGTKVGGHPIFDYDTACGLAHLQGRYQDVTRLKLITNDGVREIERYGWLKRTPISVAAGEMA